MTQIVQSTAVSEPVSRRPIRWHWVYFLLAGFDLLTVAATLSLSHRISEIYSASVSVNQQWAERLGRFDELNQLASKVNAPGNDVFDSHNVPVESRRAAVARQEFQVRMQTLRAELDQDPSKAEVAPLLEDLMAIGEAMDRMYDEATLIFSYFAAKRPDRAGRRMATMDRRYAQVNDDFARLNADVREIQRLRFARQVEDTIALRQYEYFITAFILVMVVSVTLYGRKLSSVMARTEAERDKHQAALAIQAAELKLAMESAEAANRAKSQFLANMSHELRTPMHAVLSYSKLGLEALGKGLLVKEKLHKYFARIDLSASRLMILLNDLLDIAKLEAGRKTYDFRRGDVKPCIEAVMAELSELAKGKNISMRVELSCSDTQAWFDAPSIEQVVRNLLANALKFSPSGKQVAVIVADGRLPEHDGDQESRSSGLEISVKDEGIGIPERELESIFDEFFQSSRTKSGAGGTGLGLAIVRRIITDHGGVIQARNNSEGGATVTFLIRRLALQQEADVAVDDTDDSIPQGPTEAGRAGTEAA